MKNALYLIILSSNKSKLLVKDALQFKYPNKETKQHWSHYLNLKPIILTVDALLKPPITLFH